MKQDAPLLLIRCVSLQQIDRLLPLIARQYPGHPLHLLTHDHALPFLENHPQLERVIGLGSPQPFHPRRPPWPKPLCRYALSLVPVGNRSGSGFAQAIALGRVLGQKVLLVSPEGTLLPPPPRGRVILLHLASTLLWPLWSLPALGVLLLLALRARLGPPSKE